MDPFALPTPHEAEDLLQWYFATVNMMVPCMHEETFRATYRRARNDGVRAVRRSWLGIANMMFALATNISTPTSPPLERATRSEMYFERALELVRPEILGRLSLELGISYPCTSPCSLPSITSEGNSAVVLPHVDLPPRHSVLFPGVDLPRPRRQRGLSAGAPFHGVDEPLTSRPRSPAETMVLVRDERSVMSPTPGAEAIRKSDTRQLAERHVRASSPDPGVPCETRTQLATRI